MTIGRLSFGLRSCERYRFRWFYHPLTRLSEENLRLVFYVWIGWHFEATLRMKGE